jgi:hypothetical protein
MKFINAIIGGFTGAIALNLLHETVRRYDSKAPRVDLIGEEALSKSISAVGIKPPEGKDLYFATLAGDVLSNGLYYSIIPVGNPRYIWPRAAVLGLSAGFGALKLTAPMGLNDKPVNRTEKTKALTVVWYLFGALVAAGVFQRLQNRSADL